MLTNISPLHVEREIEYELNDSGSETVVYLDLFHSRVEAVKENTPLKRSIVTGITGATPGSGHFVAFVVLKC